MTTVSKKSRVETLNRDASARSAPLDGHDTVAIIGGGFTGAAVAFHLAKQNYRGRILVIEPRSHLGAGVAYGTNDAAHRINVPASKMSLIPRDEHHFVLWIKRTGAVADDADAVGADGQLYPQRSVFGLYVRDQLAPLIQAKLIEHVRAEATWINRDGSQWTIKTSDGASISASTIVLAATHPPPEVPSQIADALADDGRLIRDPSQPNALANIDKRSRVLIVGTGLTMADVVASLDLQGHTGPITALSRRGLLPRAHAAKPAVPFGYFIGVTHTAVGLLRHIRWTIDCAAAAKEPWQAVIDAVRFQAQSFWPTLPLSERRRIVRHLRPFWDVHRFRIAPQISAILARRRQAGTFSSIAAKVRSVAAANDGISVEFVRRGEHASERAGFHHIVVATGPAHRSIVYELPHFRSLAEEGVITPDALGLGISCTTRGHAIDAAGKPVTNLLVAGPLSRATWGELMGLPQVTENAVLIARELTNATTPKNSRAAAGVGGK